MSVLQVVLLVFVVFVLGRVLARYKKKEISLREWLGWTIFWLLVIVATFLPQTTDFIAQKVGLASGRGVDLAVYISIPVLFYLVFRIISKLDRIEQDQTKIIRQMALGESDDKEQDEDQ